MCFLVKLEEGSTVQIRVPVVATVVQRRNENGNMCMMIQTAGPCPTDADDVTLSNNTTSSVVSEQSDTPDGNNNNTSSSLSTISETQIEFIDEGGNVIREEEFQAESCKRKTCTHTQKNHSLTGVFLQI